MWAQLSFVLSQITLLTDRQTEFSSLDRVCIPGSAVKMKKNVKNMACRDLIIELVYTDMCDQTYTV